MESGDGVTDRKIVFRARGARAKLIRLGVVAGLLILSTGYIALQQFVAALPKTIYAPALQFAAAIWLVFEHFASLSTGFPGWSSEIVLDEEGIGGGAAGMRAGERIAWSRVNKMEIESGGVVVTFAPFNLDSNNPDDRRSEIRLASPGADAHEIATAIESFWTPLTP